MYVDNMLVKRVRETSLLDDLRETFKTLRLYDVKLNPSKCVFSVASRKFLGFMVSQCGMEANPYKVQAILEMTPPKNIKEVQSLNGRVAALSRFIFRATDKCLPFSKTLKKAFKWTEECQKDIKELKAYLTSPPLVHPNPKKNFSSTWPCHQWPSALLLSGKKTIYSYPSTTPAERSGELKEDIPQWRNYPLH